MYRLAGMILIMLLLFPLESGAWSPGDVGKSPGSFLLGFGSCYLLHEAGHIAVARSKGYRVGFDGFSIVYPGEDLTDADQLKIATAGFQAQWLASEAAFYYRRDETLTPARDNYTAGVICGHLAITAAYLTVLNKHPQGDVYSAAQVTGLSTAELAAMLAVPAILDAWRLLADDVPAWVPALSLGLKGTGLVAVWAY